MAEQITEILLYLLGLNLIQNPNKIEIITSILIIIRKDTMQVISISRKIKKET